MDFLPEIKNSVVFELKSHKPFVVSWNNTKKTL